MPFTPQALIYTLKFDGTKLDGLTVKIGSVTVAEYNKMMDLGALTERTEVKEANSWVLDLFLERLVSWDLANNDGSLVPCTIEGVSTQERWVINNIIAAWQIALVAVDVPLNKSSTSGESSEEASLGMVPESPSQ